MAKSEWSGLGCIGHFLFLHTLLLAWHAILTCHPWGLEEGLAIEESKKESLRSHSTVYFPYLPLEGVS